MQKEVKKYKVFIPKSVEINKEEQIIVKKVEASKIELEIEVTKLAYQLSQKTDLFTVPEIVAADLANGTITYRYLENIVPLSALLINGELTAEIINNVGKSIRFVHQNLVLTQKKSLDKSYDFLDPTQYRSAFLHGDFTLNNVQYDLTAKKIVILDWSTSTSFGKAGNWGVVYWDLSKFISSIFISAKVSLFYRKEYENLAYQFIKGYTSNQEELLVLKKFGKKSSSFEMKLDAENSPQKLYYYYRRYIPWRQCAYFWSKFDFKKVMKIKLP